VKHDRYSGGYRMWLLVLFVFSLVIQIPRLFASVELGDTGHHLTRQQELIRWGTLEGSAAMTFLSDVVGGLWFEAVGKYGLLWVRMGGAILNSLNALLCYAILVRFAGGRASAIAVGCAFGLLSTLAPYSLFINYYSFPAFLGIFMVYALVRGTEVVHGTSGRVWMCIAGAVIGIIPFARMPMLVIPLVAIPVLSAGWWGAYRRGKPEIASLFGSTVEGIVGAMCLALLCLMWTGMWGEYAMSVRFAFSDTPLNDLIEYSPKVLLPKYGERMIKAMVVGGGWIGALVVLQRAIKSTFGIYCAVCGTAVLVFYVHTLGPYPAVCRLREVMFGFVCVHAICKLKRNRQSRLAWVSLISVIYAAALAVGSTFALQPVVYGLGCALPASLLLFKKSSEEGRLFGPVCISLGLLFMLCLAMPQNLSWISTKSSGHLDRGVPYRAWQLAGLSDSQEKVEVLDTLLDEVARSTTPGDFCLFYNHCALLYVFSGTRPCFTSPVLFHSRDGVVQAQMERLRRKGTLPKLCVLKNGKDQPSETARDLRYLRRVLQENMGYHLYREIGGYELYRGTG